MWGVAEGAGVGCVLICARGCFRSFTHVFWLRYCLTVRISGSHPESPGSIPGIGIYVVVVDAL